MLIQSILLLQVFALVTAEENYLNVLTAFPAGTLYGVKDSTTPPVTYSGVSFGSKPFSPRDKTELLQLFQPSSLNLSPLAATDRQGNIGQSSFLTNNVNFNSIPQTSLFGGINSPYNPLSQQQIQYYQTNGVLPNINQQQFYPGAIPQSSTQFISNRNYLPGHESTQFSYSTNFNDISFLGSSPTVHTDKNNEGSSQLPALNIAQNHQISSLDQETTKNNKSGQISELSSLLTQLSSTTNQENSPNIANSLSEVLSQLNNMLKLSPVVSPQNESMNENTLSQLLSQSPELGSLLAQLKSAVPQQSGSLSQTFVSQLISQVPELGSLVTQLTSAISQQSGPRNTNTFPSRGQFNTQGRSSANGINDESVKSILSSRKID